MQAPSVPLADFTSDPYRVVESRPIALADEPTKAPDSVDKESAKVRTAELQQRLVELQNRLWADHRHKVLVVLQATDTGGKDGTIRKVFGPLNAQGVRVAGFKVPTEPELAHDYLWRVHAQTPGDGEMVVFNRSHYEDVLVVRVHNYVEPQRWKRRYRHIVEFERLLTDEGTTVIKFFLHISKDEQAARLRARLDDPTKVWKFSTGDLEERQHWHAYQGAFEEAINRTSTAQAPWYVVPADNKWFRDLVVTQAMVDTLEALQLEYPPAETGLDQIVID